MSKNAIQTPWRLQASGSMKQRYYSIINCESGLVAETDYVNRAEFIVRACNVHAEMLWALCALLDEVDTMTARVGWSGNGARELARAAILKADPQATDPQEAR